MVANPSANNAKEQAAAPTSVSAPVHAPSAGPATSTQARHSGRYVSAFVVVLLLGALSTAAFWATRARQSESTEDAFVDGNVVAVTAQVGGVVTAIMADNTDHVSAGAVLIQLDEVDTALALSRAKALLAKAVRQARAQFAAAGGSGAAVELRQIELSRVSADLARRRELQEGGAVSGEEFKHAEETVRAAQATLDTARQQFAGNQAMVDRTSLETNPDVMAAAAQVRDAAIAAYRTKVPAPVSGVVTKRNVQLGQRINPGAALMSVVPLQHVWVNANFKESQLGAIRIGQPVTLSADIYGSNVSYRGTVIGQDAGTGSAFSLLPAQNATGNWIKVVQRVPVRIALDPQQLTSHPLQLGLSMKVKVDTRQQDGQRLVSAGTAAHGDSTEVFASQVASADALVRSVIQANR